MKEEVKSEILRRMLPYLNNEQLSALENAIDSALKNADVIETPVKPHEEDHSLDSFLTAKRIEGCSEKTLCASHLEDHLVRHTGRTVCKAFVLEQVNYRF